MSLKDLVIGRLAQFLERGARALCDRIQQILNHVNPNFIGVLENAKHFAAWQSLQALVQTSNGEEALAIVEKQEVPLGQGLGMSSFV